MVATVQDWLKSLGLQEYSERFAANAIDFSVLADLTEQDLRELEIPLGHRRKLLRAIDDMKTGGQPMASEPAHTTPEPERRQISVMFCDLVGSSDLSIRLDPEDMRTIIIKLHQLTGSIVGRRNGTIARYMGDGALVYFGYPNAQEDDTQQAVQAALELSEAVPKIETGYDVSLTVRIGIATGPVVIGDVLSTADGAREKSVVGDTPNLAARLQAAAMPGSVLVCANTRRLTEGYFEFHELGPLALKGWAEPLPAWQPLRPTGASSRFEARSASARMALVGREEEIDLILRRWRSAADGDGRVVVLSGESGIGKSHISAEVESRIASEPHKALTFYCSPHHANSALFPFIGELERSAKFEHGDAPEQRIVKLAAIVAEEAPHSEHAMALLGSLLSLPTGSSHPLPPLTPQQQKEATLGLLVDRLVGLAGQKPLLIVFEDAHWADPTSLELLARLVERIPGHRILLLISARPEFKAPWPNEAHVSTVPLTRLSRGDAEAIVKRVLGGRKLPEEVLNQILARTDGVPLFIEELTKTILESGQLEDKGEQYVLSRPFRDLTIPTTLHASLMARLDRLASAREVAQVGAVIGREFTFELLSAVAEMSRNVLEQLLRQVGDSGLILQRGVVPQSVYSFKHALVRDTAYSGLLKSRRTQLHAALARVLENQFPEIVDGQPEILAHHFSEAGLNESAVRYWLQAGRKAAVRSANMEAVAHLQSGLDRIPDLQPGASRDRLELDLLMTLGPCYIAIQGPAGAEASRVFARAREVCERIGDVPEHLQVLFWITTGSVMRGELPAARESIGALMKQATLRNDQPALLNATRGSAMILMFMGHLREASEMIERAYRTFQESSEEAHMAARAAGQDAGVADLALMSWTLWLSGRPDTAAKCVNDALQRAEAIHHPHSQAYACYYGSILYAMRGERQEAHACAERCLALAQAHGFRQWNSLARTVTAVLASLANGSGLLEPVKAALEEYRSAGYQLGITTIYVLLSQSLLHHKEYDTALEIVTTAFATVHGNSERIFEAELYRLQASAVLGRNGGTATQEVSDLLTHAIAVARAQDARALELRAACDLAELRVGQGRSDEAYAVLAPLCGSFTEGEDTSDLRRARSVLDSLGKGTCGRFDAGS